VITARKGGSDGKRQYQQREGALRFISVRQQFVQTPVEQVPNRATLGSARANGAPLSVVQGLNGWSYCERSVSNTAHSVEPFLALSFGVSMDHEDQVPVEAPV